MFSIQRTQNGEAEDDCESKRDLFKPILFSKHMVGGLFERMTRLGKFLRRSASSHGVDEYQALRHSTVLMQHLPKYQDIFEAVSPLLGSIYRRVNSLKAINIVDRFTIVEQNFDHIKSFVTADIPSFFACYSLEKIPTHESLFETITTFKGIGTLTAKNLVKKVAKLQRRDNHNWEDVFAHVTKESQIRLTESCS